MRNTTTLLACSAALCGAIATASGNPVSAQSLESRVQAAGSSGIVSFTYPTRPGVCGDGEGLIARRGANPDDVSITQMEGTFNTSTDSRASRARLLDNCVAGPARVELTRRNGTYTDFRVTVGGSRAATLGTVTAPEAVAFLVDFAATAPHKVGTKALFATTISNAPAEAAAGLIALTRRASVDREVRKDAVFWVGQTGDPRAVPRLQEILRDRREHVEVRKSSIFALSQQEGSSAVPMLLDAAKSADLPELRKDAIFWLGQKAADRATDGLESILEDGSEELEVRESAIFALSQQKTDHAFTTLLDVARTAKEPALRRSAMFWLGQRGDDPRVLKLFEDILLKR